jgi:hypothetical protein
MDSNINIKNSVLNNGSSIRGSSKNDFKIFYLNINHIINKIARLEYLLASLSSSFDVLIFCETWLMENELSYINLAGFQSFHKPKPSNRSAGGLSIFVRNSFNANLFLHDFSICNSTNGHEFFLVKLPDFNLTICATYRQPISDKNSYLLKLDSLLSNQFNMLVAGDTNIDLLKSNIASSNFTSILESNGFFLLNKADSDFYTRGIKTLTGSIRSKTVIDQIFTNSVDFNDPKVFLGDTDISDHRFIVFSHVKPNIQHQSVLSCHKKIDFDKVSNQIPNFNKNSFDSFFNDLLIAISSR